MRSLATHYMRSLIEASRTDGDSLADDPDLVMAAKAMDELGVYSAYLVRDTEEFFPDYLSTLFPERTEEELEQEARKLREALGLSRPEDAPAMHPY